jgi:hypothetical protein
MRLEKFVWTAVAIGAALCIGTSPIAAKPGPTKPTTPKMMHAAQPKPTTHGSPKIKTTTSSPKTMTHGQSATKTKTTTTAVKTTTKSPKTTKNAKATTTKDAKTATGNSKKQPAETTTAGEATTSGTSTDDATDGTTDGTTEPTAPLTKSQQQLTKNTKLQTKLQTRLGSQLPEGVSVIDAASGFKNLGQFVAAVNVSNNLGIPFADLKAKMTGMNVDGTPVELPEGTTAPAMLSLGQAIQSLKGMDSATATQTANTATTQANTEIANTSGH